MKVFLIAEKKTVEVNETYAARLIEQGKGRIVTEEKPKAKAKEKAEHTEV